MGKRKPQRSTSDRRVWSDPVILTLAEITSTPILQVRQETKEWKVREYVSKMTAGEDLGPVKVARLPEGALLLIDGFHRVRAIETLRGTHVEVEITDVASIDEARIEGGLANLGHGLELSKIDKRGVFRAYIKAKYHIMPNGSLQSYREIAKGLRGMQWHSTIRNWMLADFPVLAHKISKQEPATPPKDFSPGQLTTAATKEEETQLNCTAARAGINLALNSIGKLNTRGNATSTLRGLQTWAEMDLKQSLLMIDDVELEQERQLPVVDPDAEF